MLILLAMIMIGLYNYFRAYQPLAAQPPLGVRGCAAAHPCVALWRSAMAEAGTANGCLCKSRIFCVMC